MRQEPGILIGKTSDGEGRDAVLALRYANRHGLIAGATGTGKTVTLQTLAEGFSNHGVPVFLADVKGDLSGLAVAGSADGKIAERAARLGLADHVPRAFPVVFWDLLGEQGHPIRTTISEMGPLLLARLLDLNETQAGVLHVAFAVADDEGMLLLDLKDLRAMLAFVGDNAKTLQATYGNISAASVGAIQRSLLVLEREGGDRFFGEPALDIGDLMRSDTAGLGVINILAADKLINRPRLYSTFLLWLLSELFEDLPEAGDLDRPKLVFFFDEAHLLFDSAPKTLLAKIEQVVRLIRSKGVGVYFISQSPTDIPDDVLAQLGNRVQHALRAFTAKDQKAVKAAAATFRANPKFDVQTAITELGVGEALVSVLEGNGSPGVVERVLIAPPASRVGPADLGERTALLRASAMAGRYDQPIDRFSAYEHLKQRSAAAAAENAAGPPRPTAPAPASRRRSRGVTEDVVGALASSAARSIGSRLGRELVRGVLGSLLRR
jgi:DNA helicase HerA-like ATPase